MMPHASVLPPSVFCSVRRQYHPLFTYRVHDCFPWSGGTGCVTGREVLSGTNVSVTVPVGVTPLIAGPLSVRVWVLLAVAGTQLGALFLPPPPWAGQGQCTRAHAVSPFLEWMRDAAGAGIRLIVIGIKHP
jgi:hypothetical protein